MLTFAVKFDVDTTDEDGNEVAKERTLRYYATLRGEAAGRSKALLQKLDPEIDFSTFAPGDADERFGGMDVRIRVTIRPDRDDRKVKRNNIADMEPLSEEDI